MKKFEDNLAKYKEEHNENVIRYRKNIRTIWMIL